MQSQFWCFTQNNPEEDPSVLLHSFSYLVYQVEESSTGTAHCQGYVVFSQRQRLTNLVRLFSGFHWEPRKGTHTQAKAYCMKEDTRLDGPYEFGDDTSFLGVSAGKRTDLSLVKEKLDSGVSCSEIAEEHFGSWVRYHKSFVLYQNIISGVRDWKMDVRCFWGVPNSGKSCYARKVAEELGSVYYLARPNAKGAPVWWDGYAGQHTVVINEFYGWMQYAELLSLLDETEHKVAIKGALLQFTSKVIIITSNLHPSEWYKKLFSSGTASFEPLFTRFTSIHEFDTRFSSGRSVPSQDIIRVNDDGSVSSFPSLKIPSKIVVPVSRPSKNPFVRKNPFSSSIVEVPLPVSIPSLDRVISKPSSGSSFKRWKEHYSALKDVATSRKIDEYLEEDE